MSNNFVDFFIESIDEDQKTFVVKFYCTEFKKSREQYPSINISLNYFDSTIDLNTQLLNIIYPTIKNILLQEQEVDVEILKTVKSLVNNTVTIPISAAELKVPVLDVKNKSTFRKSNKTSLLNFINV